MTSTTFFFIFIPLLAIILLAVNLFFAPHNPYQEKDSAFECGFHSFLGQNRTQFSISFFIFALLFLLFDLEILLVYPYIVSAYTNGIYGLVVMLIFFLVLTLGFAFELGKNALKIDSRQMFSVSSKQSKVKNSYSNLSPVLLLPIYSFINTIYVNINLCYEKYFFGFIISLSITLFVLWLIHLFASSSKSEETTNTESHLPLHIRGDNNCIHNWKAFYQSYKCGFKVHSADKACKMENPIMWKCSKCGDIRCGTHAQSHWPKNEGGAYRGDRSP